MNNHPDNPEQEDEESQPVSDPLSSVQPIRIAPRGAPPPPAEPGTTQPTTPVEQTDPDATRPFTPAAPSTDWSDYTRPTPLPPLPYAEQEWEPRREPEPTQPSYPPVPPPAPPRRTPPPPPQAYTAYPPYPDYPPAALPPRKSRRRFSCFGCGCLPVVLVILLLAVYFLIPGRTTLLIMGIDRTPEGTFAGRSDTNILVTVLPTEPKVSMLSVPRDLWVNLPRVGPQRINTAHYFAELEEPGSGPRRTAEAFQSVFGIYVPYYARFSFDSLVGIVDAMGGVRINLPEDTAGLTAGEHVLDGTQALAFARSRTGSDDFFRMEHGQFLIRSMMRQMLRPESWPRLPQVFSATMQAVDTNLPVWLWPRVGLAVLRAGPDGIDTRTLNRDMVAPWTTDEGAQVLLPNWAVINPMLDEIFGPTPADLQPTG